jgi:hypothetical protein
MYNHPYRAPAGRHQKKPEQRSANRLKAGIQEDVLNKEILETLY